MSTAKARPGSLVTRYQLIIVIEIFGHLSFIDFPLMAYDNLCCVILKIDVDTCWYGSQFMIFKPVLILLLFYASGYYYDRSYHCWCHSPSVSPLPLSHLEPLEHVTMTIIRPRQRHSLLSPLCHYTDLLSCVSCVWVWCHEKLTVEAEEKRASCSLKIYFRNVNTEYDIPTH